MEELINHINALLLENDCVIIPGFGGFITHYVPSQIEQESDIFSPPYRVIAFNPKLKLNDGLIAQAYMSTNGTSFTDANRRLNKDIAELVNTLTTSGSYTFPNIGVIKTDINGQLKFIPEDTKSNSTYNYGLDAFQIPNLVSLRASKVLEAINTPSIHKEQIKRVKHSKEFVPYIVDVAALIAIILSFFMFSTPIKNTEILGNSFNTQKFTEEINNQIQSSSLAFNPIIEKLNIKQNHANTAKSSIGNSDRTSIVPVNDEADEKVILNQESNLTLPKTETVDQTKPAKMYHIIVASMPTQQSAAEFAQNLVKEGYNKTTVIVGDGKQRVSLDSFATEAEAYKIISKLRKQPKFEQAWVLKW